MLSLILLYTLSSLRCIVYIYLGADFPPYKRTFEEGDMENLSKCHAYDTCIIHSGNENEYKLGGFIQSKLSHLNLTCGPMCYEMGDRDSAILNDNLKTINNSKKAIMIFSPKTREKKRCRFEQLFALHLHVNNSTQAPKIIPVVFGHTNIPLKYSVFEPLLVHQSENWCLKLLHALAEGDTELTSKTFADKGRESVDELANWATEGIFSEDDFNEFETHFDTSFFYFLDDLMKEVHNTDSSSELNEVMDLQKRLCEKLQICDTKTRMEFLRTNLNSGLSNFIGQMGLNNMHKLLMNGCGMCVRHDLISLKWKTFKENLICSTVTLADVVNFSKFLGIKRISIQFDQETNENMENNFGKDWTKLLVIFAENILKHRLNNEDNDMLTYHINFNGKLPDSVKEFANRTGRSIYHSRTQQHTHFFKHLENRIRTFSNSEPEIRSSALLYAMAGFIYSGHEDTKTCFACNQTIFCHNGSEVIDYKDILFSHCKWQPNCQFLLSLPNYNEILELVKSEQQKRENNGLPVDVTCWEIDTLSKRLLSFDKSLPRNRCLTLAQAGFYQKTNEKNNLAVKCFSCATEINYLKLSQDFWFEHVRWSPKCKFLIEKKGEGFIRDVKKVLIKEGEDDVYSEVIIETYVIKSPLQPEIKHHILQKRGDNASITETEIELD